MEAEPLHEEIALLNSWALGGHVPNVITARATSTRAFTEAYCTRARIPYAGMLLGADINSSLSELLYHMDVDFYITDNPVVWNYINEGKHSDDCHVLYVVRRSWNEGLGFEDVSGIRWVDSLKEIEEREGL